MIGSPQNNFNAMTGQQPKPLQPKNVMLGNALRNSPDTQDRQPLEDRSIQGYRQPSETYAPSMMGASQYGSPTATLPSYVKPQSNISYNLQPQIPNMQNTMQGPPGLQSTPSPYGVGLARQNNAQVR